MAQAGAIGVAKRADRRVPARVPCVRRMWDGDVELTDVTGAAYLAGVSRRTIYNWMAKGHVETRRTASGHLRIVVATLWRDVTPAAPPAQPQPSEATA